jgi:hypothetical protein
VLDVDLTIPIAILGTAVVLVLAVRAWLGWEERRMAERTTALLRDLGPTDESHEASGDADVHDEAPRERAGARSDEP